jgi:hypothetical protein
VLFSMAYRRDISATCEVSSWPRTSGCLNRSDRRGQYPITKTWWDLAAQLMW